MSEKSVFGKAGALVCDRSLSIAARVAPPIYVIVSIGLVSIAAIASYVSARRAMLVDPVLTLRGE